MLSLVRGVRNVVISLEYQRPSLTCIKWSRHGTRTSSSTSTNSTTSPSMGFDVRNRRRHNLPSTKFDTFHLIPFRSMSTISNINEKEEGDKEADRHQDDVEEVEDDKGSNSNSTGTTTADNIRLSKVLSHYTTNLTLSRRQAERLIHDGQVTLAGKIVRTPHLLLNWDDLGSERGNVVLKVQGKPVLLLKPSSGSDGDGDGDSDGEKDGTIPKVWAVHKLSGEVVTENDPHNRPSMIQRLVRGGVGRRQQHQKNQHQQQQQQQYHLKPIGRLDMTTEGLILVTNDGEYARQMELPKNQLHRIYRVRVHGRLSQYKLDQIRYGSIYDEKTDTRYRPMQVMIETRSGRANGSGGRRGRGGTTASIGPTSTNTWLRVICTEGKNRQIRNVFSAMGSK